MQFSSFLITVDQWFSTGGDFGTQETFCNVQRHFWLSQLGRGCHWYHVGGGWGCCWPSSVHKPLQPRTVWPVMSAVQMWEALLSTRSPWGQGLRWTGSGLYILSVCVNCLAPGRASVSSAKYQTITNFKKLFLPIRQVKNSILFQCAFIKLLTRQSFFLFVCLLGQLCFLFCKQSVLPFA